MLRSKAGFWISLLVLLASSLSFAGPSILITPELTAAMQQVLNNVNAPSESNVNQPSGGLGGASNYIMYSPSGPSSCNYLKDVSVSIEITQDIVSNIGVGFQLNAYSPTGMHPFTDGWQQYGQNVSMNNGFDGGGNSASTLFGWVEPWPQVSPAGYPGTDLINQGWPLMTLPNPTLRAGTRIVISLGNDPNENVRYVTLQVFDGSNLISSTTPPLPTVDLTTLHLDYGPKPRPLATTADLSPIVGFQLDVVGPTNGEHAYLWQGAGTITYSASPSTPLQPTNNWLSCADNSSGTAENANTVYAPLPGSSGSSITQTFNTQTPPPYLAGGPIAASRRPGGANQVYATNAQGQINVVLATSAGQWSNPSTSLGLSGLLQQQAALATVPQSGGLTDVLAVDQGGNLDVFSSLTGTESWNGPPQINKNGLPAAAFVAASPHIGLPGQIDAFVVDNNGQLDVYYLAADGAWTGGPLQYSPANSLPGNAGLAASEVFGSTTLTGVFVVDNNGRLNVFTAATGEEWDGGPLENSSPNSLSSGAPIAASQQIGVSNQTDVFVVDSSGRLNVFWQVGYGSWQGPKVISPPGTSLPSPTQLAASQQFGVSNQTDVFLVDGNGQLNVYSSVSPGTWSNKTIGPANLAPPGAYVAAMQDSSVSSQTDVFLIDNNGNLDMFWSGPNGNWDAMTTGGCAILGETAYNFACDGTTICALPAYVTTASLQNAQNGVGTPGLPGQPGSCLNSGWCTPSTGPASDYSQGACSCSKVPSAANRDLAGAWLLNVLYPPNCVFAGAVGGGGGPPSYAGGAATNATSPTKPGTKEMEDSAVIPTSTVPTH